MSKCDPKSETRPWRADRASRSLILAAKRFEDNLSTLNIQARHLARRFGLSASSARLVALMAFAETRA